MIAALLTPSSDPWNQTLFAAPMLLLYLLSIGIAWVVAPRRRRASSRSGDSTKLRLVVGAMVLDQAVRNRRRTARERAA